MNILLCIIYSQVSRESGKMKSNPIEILNGAGTTVACYEGVESVTSISCLHPGYLMEITPSGLSQYRHPLADDNQPEEPNRFVVAKD